MAAVTIFFTACNNDSNEMADEQSVIDMSDFYVYTDADIDEASRLSADSKSKSCYTMVNLNRLLNENPELERKMYDIEYHTRANIAGKKPDGVGNGNGGGSGGDGGSGGGDNLGVINIPVYVHVVYSNSQENVSDNQINSQIAVLNDDFRKGNNDISQVPALFENVVADSEITFSLAQDGIKRHSNTTSSWGTNDAVKAAYPPITPETHLNIWVCNIGGGILGYAQFPGGPSSTDGVVLLYSSLPGGSAAPYNLGRTATHEVGHYLNLRHIWGDGRCNRDDFVSDTPTSDRPNYGCPSFPTTHCRSTDMTMNYMDYTDDACMFMFSEGQKVRMRTIFDAGGARESMLN
jgi:hypothetical protein